MTFAKSQMRLAGSLCLPFLMFFAASASAQSGPDSFTMTTSALAGTVTCSNGTVTPISVDPSTTTDSGSNESIAGATSLTACGQSIYQASSIDDKSHADDTAALDDASGETDAQNVSILGGLVTFSSEQAPATCQTTDSAGDVVCGGDGHFSHLAINGSAVAAGDYAPGSSFQIVNAQVVAPDCVGVSLFTGQLTMLDSQTANNDTASPESEGEWLHLTGQATCVGLPLGATTHYDLRDDNFTKIIDHVSKAKVCWWDCGDGFFKKYLHIDL